MIEAKYGENHSKIAALMDLAVIGETGKRSTVYTSVLGKEFYKLEENIKVDLAKRLLLRIPIIQNAFKNQSLEQIDKDLDILSSTTKKRRRSNVINVIRSIVKDNENLSNMIGFKSE